MKDFTFVTPNYRAAKYFSKGTINHYELIEDLILTDYSGLNIFGRVLKNAIPKKAIKKLEQSNVDGVTTLIFIGNEKITSENSVIEILLKSSNKIKFIKSEPYITN